MFNLQYNKEILESSWRTLTLYLTISYNSFAFDELMAGARALGRRFDTGGEPSKLHSGDIVLDLRDHRAERGELSYSFRLPSLTC